jgi:hypothetical protein
MEIELDGKEESLRLAYETNKFALEDQIHRADALREERRLNVTLFAIAVGAGSVTLKSVRLDTLPWWSRWGMVSMLVLAGVTFVFSVRYAMTDGPNREKPWLLTLGKLVMLECFGRLKGPALPPPLPDTTEQLALGYKDLRRRAALSEDQVLTVEAFRLSKVHRELAVWNGERRARLGASRRLFVWALVFALLGGGFYAAPGALDSSNKRGETSVSSEDHQNAGSNPCQCGQRDSGVCCEGNAEGDGGAGNTDGGGGEGI